MGKSRQVEQYLLLNPTATIKEIVEITGVSARTAQTVKSRMMKSGQIPRTARTKPTETLLSLPSGELLTPEMASALANPEHLDEDIVDDEATQKRMLREVQNLAFNPAISPDIRMNAMKVWVTIKDIVRAKTLGPGNPLTEEEATIRLVRIMQAAGVKLTINALERAFKMKGSGDETAQNEQIGAPEGTSEAPNATGDENPEKTP